MARDPNARRGSPTLIEKPGEMPPGAVLPPEVKKVGIGTGNGQYYGYRVIYENGRSEIEWYKRGSGGGPDQPDPVELRSEAPVAVDVKEAWDKGEEKDQATASKREKRKYPGTDPQTGLPAIVTEYEDGTFSYDSSARPTTNAGTEAKPPETKDEGGSRYVWQPNPGGPNAGGKWVAVGSAPETPAERATREANAPTQTVATREVGGKVYTVVTIVPKPGQPGQPGQIVLGPDGKQVAGGIPGEPPKRTPVTRNGKTYFQVQGADGSIYFEDQAGTRVPLPDDANAGPYTGPKMPQIVLGQAAAALQALGDQIARDPSLTPEQRTRMWNEAIQTANVAVAEAGVLQRERESNLNAQVNLSTTILKNQSDAFNGALTFAADLNSKLPPGSPLGGQAFAAMFGMQMILAHKSGIYDIKTPGTPVADAASRTATPAPAPVLANPGNRAAVEAQRQEVAAQTAQVAQQRSAPPAQGPNPATPNLVPPPPPTASRPNPTALAAASPGSEDALLQQNQAAASGAAVMPPGAPAADGNESPDDILTVAELGPDGQRTGRTVQISRADYEASLANDPNQANTTVVDNAVPNPSRAVAPAVAPTPSAVPDTGGAYDPSQATGSGFDPHAPGQPRPQGMTPPSPVNEIAALAPFRPQPVAPAPQGIDMRQNPALLSAQAASKPLWRMTPDEYQQYVDAGVPDDIIRSVPGVAA